MAIKPNSRRAADDLGAGVREKVGAARTVRSGNAELTVDEMTEGIVARTGSWAGDLVMEAFQGKWPR